ncbi:amino acid transporter [Fusarium coicis]|nr:amino acid transporter [Fusarium coicis]
MVPFSSILSLLLAFIFWVTVAFSVAQCQMEIATLFPFDGSSIRFAGRMVDPALGFAQTSCVISEATIINTLVEYWGYDQSPDIPITDSDSRQRLPLRVVLALDGSVFKKTLFHRALDVDLVSHFYFFDVLTEHYRHEREAAPQNFKDEVLTKIF